MRSVLDAVRVFNSRIEFGQYEEQLGLGKTGASTTLESDKWSERVHSSGGGRKCHSVADGEVPLHRKGNRFETVGQALANGPSTICEPFTTAKGSIGAALEVSKR